MSLKEKSIMPPPWLAAPKIEAYSIGWRMGYGEDYMWRLRDWLDSLSESEQEEYRALFPEPVTWLGWWSLGDEDEDTDAEECADDALVLQHKDFYVQAWQPQGQPKYTRAWLEQEFAAKRQKHLCLFWGHQPSSDGTITQSCLSQWWPAEFYGTGARYFCMEQYMMAAKAELFGDTKVHQQILESNSPKQIKALGRKVQGFEQAIWDKFKYSIVLNGNYLKFSQNPELQSFLLSTGEKILVEASPFDAIWGIHLSSTAPEAKNPLLWRGQNLLGFALMEVRDELRRVTHNAHLCDWSCVPNR